MKKLFLTILCVASIAVVYAQSGTNSPYSQYGLGNLSDQGNGYVRGMNGVGIAMHDHDRINFLNPASYAQLDSLSFFFDTGLSLQSAHFSEGGRSTTAKNANFEYAMGAFRVVKNLGLAFGIVPVSNIGYNYTATSTVSSYHPMDIPSAVTNTITNTGSGGLHEAFIGIGWRTNWKSPVNFSLGVNGGYVWGSLEKSVTNTYSDNYVNTFARVYTAEISSYVLDFGLQVTGRLPKDNKVIVGATYTLGHKLGANPMLSMVSTNPESEVVNDTTFIAQNGYELPTKIGVGLTFVHKNMWRVGIDYTIEKWSKVSYPRPLSTIELNDMKNGVTSDYQYKVVGNMFNDRRKINIGGEYCQNEYSRSFFPRIRYRLGASYTTPYLKINGMDGPKEYAVSLGFGIPIVNGYSTSSRHISVVNVSAQWVRTSMTNAITENTFRVNIGLTFNERWFAKWKFE